MRIGVPAESKPGETRVAATPKTVGQLIGLGYDVVVERGAGARSSFSDEAYAAAGASVVDGAVAAWASDVVLKVNAPSDAEIGSAACRFPARLPGLAGPQPRAREKLTAAGVTALAMDAVPRISRAQSLDVLSSMANIGGYRAVIEAAHEFGSLFTGQVTAAGKVPPAKVLVVGAGVAGLAAIGTASSLGAMVRAFDAGQRSASRSSRWAPSSCVSRSRTRVRPPPATPRRWERTSTARPPSSTPSRPRTSTSSSPRHSSPAGPRRGCSPRRWWHR